MILKSLPNHIQESQSDYSSYETIILSSSPVFEFKPTPIHSLWLILHRLDDPRRAQGKRHSLPVVLMLGILAMACGDASYQAMSEWSENYQDRLEIELPFLSDHTPAKSTFHRVFSSLDTKHLEKVLGCWLQTITDLEKHEGIAIDGKAVKNTELFLVSAFAHKAKAVLFQQATKSKGKELVIAPKLLKQIDIQNKMITGDALFTQRNLCKQITTSGAGYVFSVKDNQKSLKENITTYFSDPFSDNEIESSATLTTHAGRAEKREVKVSSNKELIKYLNWPGLTHVIKLEREVVVKATGETATEEVFGIGRFLNSNKVSDQANQLIRGHWSIENNLHLTRDVSFGEDKSSIRTKSGPQVMSILGNIITSIFNKGKIKSFQSAFRRFAAQPKELFAFLGLYQHINAAYLPV